MTRSEKSALLKKDMTLRGYFEVVCSEGQQQAALWLDGDEERSYTYGELHSRAFACAQRVEALELGEPGGWVGIAVDTCPDWPVLLWGVLAAGRQPVLIDPSLEDGPVEHLLRQAGATGFIARRRRGLPARYAQAAPEALLTATEPAPGFRPQWADRLALCTSGTTATSRVFVYDGRAICMQALGIVEAQKKHPFTCEKRGSRKVLCFLPLNHVFGLMTNMVWNSFVGYTQVYLKDRAPQTILETCRRTGVEIILAVPLLINNLSVTLRKRIARETPAKRRAVTAMMGTSLALQRAAPSAGLRLARRMLRAVNENLFGDTLEVIIVGGSHTPLEHLKTITALGYEVVAGFGMTETGITSVEVEMPLKHRLGGGTGFALPIAQYKVRPGGSDPNHGELFIKTEAMHIGRLEEGRLVPPALLEGGWYETGDVARLDGKGRLYVEGRVKDIILGESGENVYPDELEDLFSDMEGVEQFCVLGTKDEGGLYDVTTLVLSVGARFGDEAFLLSTARQVAQRNRALPPFKRVALVLATPEALPVVNAIKVKRVALREQIERRKITFRAISGQTAAAEPQPQKIDALPEPAQTPENLQLDEIREKVRVCFAQVLEREAAEIGWDAHFIDDLGGDSLQSLGVSLKVEEVFGITIPMEEYTRCTSVNDLSAVVYARMRGHGPYEAEAVRDGDAEVEPITRFEDTPEWVAFQARMDSVRGQENPYFVSHDSALKDTSLMNGKEVLNFGSYNYAGMSGRKETMEAAKAAIDKYGTSASGSRLLAGEKPLYQELEREIARWKHAEAALVLVGGHSTNVTIVGNFCGKNDLIVYDAIAHNSVQEGCRLSGATSKPFPHNGVEALESILRAQRNKFAKVLIIVEGVYSMDGDIAPIPEIVALKKKYGCFLLVDEAHSACVIGKTGGGVDEYFGLKHDDIDIKMGTLSKGLGACGGYLAGSRALIEYLRYNLPGFVFSVGISPPVAAAALTAVRLLSERPEIMESLRRNVEIFLREARARNLNTCLAMETAIIPVLVGADEDAFLLSTALSHRGVFVPPAVYPAVPKNKARLRFCVISEHKPEQIVKALDTLVETAVEMGIRLPPSAQGR